MSAMNNSLCRTMIPSFSLAREKKLTRRLSVIENTWFDFVELSEINVTNYKFEWYVWHV